MADIKEAARQDSDRSSNEKALPQTQLENGVNPLVADLPPDPDAHLSPEERAAIVGFLQPHY